MISIKSSRQDLKMKMKILLKANSVPWRPPSPGRCQIRQKKCDFKKCLAPLRCSTGTYRKIYHHDDFQSTRKITPRSADGCIIFFPPSKLRSRRAVPQKQQNDNTSRRDNQSPFRNKVLDSVWEQSICMVIQAAVSTLPILSCLLH